MNNVNKNKIAEYVKIFCVILGALFVNVICNTVFSKIYEFVYIMSVDKNTIDLSQVNSMLMKNPIFLLVLSASNMAVILFIFIIARRMKVNIAENFKFGRDLKIFTLWVLLAFVNMFVFSLFGIGMNLFDFNEGTCSEFSKITVIEFVITVVIYSLISGVCEEVIYRGYILNRLRNLVPKYALAVSSFIFMLSEVLGTQFRIIDYIGVFLAGIFFGYLYLSTSSIIPGAGFHAGVHFALVMGTKFQDMPIYQGPVFSIFNAHKDIMIGNIDIGSSYGITTAVINLACVLLLYLYNKKNSKHTSLVSA